MTLSIGVGGIVTGILSPIGASQIQSAVQSTAYPNVYVSVSELQIPSLSEVINGVGGYYTILLRNLWSDCTLLEFKNQGS